MSAVLVARSLRKTFPSKRNMFGMATEWTPAVKDVSLEVNRGETYGLVGESGAGKSTVGRMILRLIEPDAGEIVFDGVDVLALSRTELRSLRSDVRMIFQDPFVSLDPSMVVGASVAEPLKVQGRLDRRGRVRRVLELFERVGLEEQHLDRYPAEFSGGQLQRVAVARAIATNPKVIVCDEPVAALDMSIRAQVINLLRDLQDEFGIALIFISHDLSLVRLIADQVAVMYSGRIVETGSASDVFESPGHPYTRALLSAVPIPDPNGRHRMVRVAGPRFSDSQGSTEGCDYADRCAYAADRCSSEQPELRESGRTHLACHYAGEGLCLPKTAPR